MKSDVKNNQENHYGPSPHDPLDQVISVRDGGSMLRMQTGLFRLGHNRAVQSGTTEPQPDDICALEDHARAMARETYRDRYDPEAHTHDAMHKREYKRSLADRDEAEKGERHAAANLRDAEDAVAGTPTAGEKPKIPPVLVAAFVIAITLTIAPTLHDTIFHTIGDDLLEWFAASVSAGFVAVMLTLSILSGRRTAWSWLGAGAGVTLGLGLGVVRLASAEDARDTLFAFGLTAVEIAAVLLLEWVASALRARETVWEERHATEAEAIGRRDAAAADLARRQARIRELREIIAGQIAVVEDRHNRNIHIGELEAVAIKAVNDGYNAGIAENLGRVRGVMRRDR
jgi:hypothetical protein